MRYLAMSSYCSYSFVRILLPLMHSYLFLIIWKGLNPLGIWSKILIIQYPCKGCTMWLASVWRKLTKKLCVWEVLRKTLWNLEWFWHFITPHSLLGVFLCVEPDIKYNFHQQEQLRQWNLANTNLFYFYTLLANMHLQSHQHYITPRLSLATSHQTNSQTRKEFLGWRRTQKKSSS